MEAISALIAAESDKLKADIAGIFTSSREVKVSLARTNQTVNTMDGHFKPLRIINHLFSLPADRWEKIQAPLQHFTEGENVAIHWFGQRPLLNGNVGVFDYVDPDAQRCVVRLPHDEQVLVKHVDLLKASLEQRLCALNLGFCSACQVGDAHELDNACPYCGASPIAEAAAAASSS
jgi:hypothetical protein